VGRDNGGGSNESMLLGPSVFQKMKESSRQKREIGWPRGTYGNLLGTISCELSEWMLGRFSQKTSRCSANTCSIMLPAPSGACLGKALVCTGGLYWGPGSWVDGVRGGCSVARMQDGVLATLGD